MASQVAHQTAGISRNVHEVIRFKALPESITRRQKLVMQCQKLKQGMVVE